MLEIKTPSCEFFDEDKGEFITIHEQTLKMEHSLISISKWESKWCTPFFSREPKTTEQLFDYFRCMTITQVNPLTYLCLDDNNIKQIDEYINSKQSAVIFYNMDNGGGAPKEKITSELIYYWMVALNIPLECEKWNINRLFNLIRICNIKSQPPKKLSEEEVAERNRRLNEERKKRFNSKG